MGKWDVLEICCGQGSWSARVAAGKAVQEEFLSGGGMTRREREREREFAARSRNAYGEQQ